MRLRCVFTEYGGNVDGIHKKLHFIAQGLRVTLSVSKERLHNLSLIVPLEA
jgi:hypothetical protein